MTLPVEHDRLAQIADEGGPYRRLRRCAHPVGACRDLVVGRRSGPHALGTSRAFDGRRMRGAFVSRRRLLAKRIRFARLCRQLYAGPASPDAAGGGCRSVEPPPHAVAVHIGSDSAPIGTKLQGWTDGWLALVGSPSVQDTRPGNELSGALSGAMLVTEAFRLAALGDLAAGRRTQRLSPLTPDNPTPDGIALTLLPSAAWVLGLGNLGQALLWTLGLLPYADPGNVHLVLQDMDCTGPENADTQLLTKPDWIKRKKTRNAAHWAEERGFTTVIDELPFRANTTRDDNSPGLAFIGVDNLQTRRFAARPGTGFDLVIDAGLGATAHEVFDIRLHAFPGFRSAEDAWPEPAADLSPQPPRHPNLEKLVSQGRLDPCGALTIGELSVGVPSHGRRRGGHPGRASLPRHSLPRALRFRRSESRQSRPDANPPDGVRGRRSPPL